MRIRSCSACIFRHSLFCSFGRVPPYGFFGPAPLLVRINMLMRSKQIVEQDAMDDLRSSPVIAVILAMCQTVFPTPRSAAGQPTPAPASPSKSLLQTLTAVRAAPPSSSLKLKRPLFPLPLRLVSTWKSSACNPQLRSSNMSQIQSKKRGQSLQDRRAKWALSQTRNVQVAQATAVTAIVV